MEGETILCLATRRWNSLWRSTQQIMSRMATKNRVLYLEPGRDPDRPVIAEMIRNSPNFITVNVQVVHENLKVIRTPSVLPYARGHLPSSVLNLTLPLATKINAYVLIWHIRRVMKKLDVTAPILWLYNPYHVDLVGKFGEKLAGYYNYDEFGDFVGNESIKELIQRYDNQLSQQVDVVFASSRPQWERRQVVNPNSYFIPNGVDFDLFNRALLPNLPLPTDMSNVPHPIIGFVGWMGFQIDVKLLRGVAESYPASSLVLVGPDSLPDTEDHRKLRALPNVYFLGQKELSELPNYLQSIDVAIIPYLCSGHGTSLYPLKLHEYLASGRAIVSTSLPSLRPYADIVRIADTHDDFIHLIREALQDHSQEAIEARIAVARENTWDQRVAEIYCVLDRMLSTRFAR